MTNEEHPRPSGLLVGSKAPLFNTVDLSGNEMNLSKLLKTFKGVLIDFFRGNW